MKQAVKRIITVLVAAGACAIGWNALTGSGGTSTIYRTVEVTRGIIAETVTANGTLNPLETATVGTQVSGQIKQLYVQVNDEVKKGDLLAEVDPSLAETQLRQSKANLETARVGRDQAKRDLDRMQTLFKKDFVAKIDLERAEQSYLSARNSYDFSKTQVERDEVSLGYTKIISPIDGVIISQEITLGQTMAANFQTPNLFKIAGDLKKMKIDVSFAESDISKVKQNMPVKFTVDAFTDREFEGKVQTINLNPINQSGVVMYSVTVAVDNPDKVLLPGMTAYVSVVLSEVKDVLRVPASALRFTPPPEQGNGLKALFQPSLRSGALRRLSGDTAVSGKATIYLLKNGAPVPVEVTVGKSDDSNVAIFGEGIKEGERVITGIVMQEKR